MSPKKLASTILGKQHAAVQRIATSLSKERKATLELRYNSLEIIMNMLCNKA